MRAKPKKSLGQNFLIDKNISRKIINSCGLNSHDILLEIGGGYGALTELIADRVKKVFVLEIDKNLCGFLEEKLKGFKNTEIINQDILKFNLRRHFRRYKAKIKVLGNIPYQISSPLVEHLFKFRDKIDSVFITVQKEFARRMAARAGSKDYSSFSCFVQYYAEPIILFDISRNCFRPRPKVSSSFLNLKIRKAAAVKIEDEGLFFRIIRASFNKRRKTLRNSLEQVIPGQKLLNFFNKHDIDQNIRPESLTLQDFANLTNT